MDLDLASISKKQELNCLSLYKQGVISRVTQFTRSVPLTQRALFPNNSGVYCLFENEILIYVGETGCLRARMKDIFHTMNHSFRRSLGKHKYAHIPEISEVCSKKNFPFDIELELTKYMESSIRVTHEAVAIGRKEIEEEIFEIHKPIYNIRGLRKPLL